ncbi:hypothetical protein ALC56_12656, partial [Trachymyrmex septentrionalis]
VSGGIENVIGEKFVIVAAGTVRDILASLASLYPRIASLQRENQANGGFRGLGVKTKTERGIRQTCPNRNNRPLRTVEAMGITCGRRKGGFRREEGLPHCFRVIPEESLEFPRFYPTSQN